jgi:ABC-type nitrate/sulfonate/bicarbonate transport system substrate-binding protein
VEDDGLSIAPPMPYIKATLLRNQIRRLSGWWPMLSMFAGMSLLFAVLGPFSQPPMPVWVQPTAIAGTIIFGGPAIFIILKKRSLIKKLRKLT